MPLAFPSRSHDVVAFGFFNIAGDMILLEDLFFFADAFCAAAASLAERGVAAGGEERLEGWRIADRARIGNLHGAIAGVDHSGFIGATYRRYPFPADPAGFKQDPEGHRTRAEFRALLEPFGAPEEIPLRLHGGKNAVSIAEYLFDLATFGMLIAYVEKGGYPRWRDEIRPAYVMDLVDRLEAAGWWRR